MTQANAEPNGDIQEEQLNRAIEELRGVLHEEGGPAAPSGLEAAAASMRNNGVIMNIPVDVQIVVDVMVNGRRIAKGEITVLEHDPSRFGIRLTEIIAAAKTA